MSNPPYPQQPNYPQQPQPLSQNLKTGAIIMAVAAVAILIGIATKSWFTASERGGNVNIGLSGFEMCRDRGECMAVSWSDIKKAPGELKAFAYISLIGGVASIGVLLAASLMLFTGNARKVPWKPFNAVLGITVFGVVSFMFRLMFGEFSKGTSVSWSGFVALAGIIAGSVALLKIVKPEVERPA